MASATILILGHAGDDHVQHMLHLLRQRGADAELISSQWFPNSMGLAFHPESGKWRIVLPSGREIHSEQIRSIYWRSYEGIGPAQLPDEYQRFLAENDARSLLESFLIDCPTRWVNCWAAFQLHQTKPVQLARVARLGIPTPATCLANTADDISRFVAVHPSCIFKPVQGGDLARPLTAEHLTPANLENLRLAPITLQEAVPGTNIRVFVAGPAVVACEVQASTLDYRDDPHAALTVHVLPAAVEVDCRRIADELHLLWTGIDFRLTPDGQYVFLEANPSPMFLGFEAATQLPLAQLLADLLMNPPHSVGH